MRRWRPLTAVVLAAAATALWVAPARAADHGIQVLSSQQLDPRLTELTLSTDALAKPTHGALADYRSWTDAGARPAPSILSTLQPAQ